jgi:hypothetical protein
MDLYPKVYKFVPKGVWICAPRRADRRKLNAVGFKLKVELIESPVSGSGPKTKPARHKHLTPAMS